MFIMVGISPVVVIVIVAMIILRMPAPSVGEVIGLAAIGGLSLLGSLAICAVISHRMERNRQPLMVPARTVTATVVPSEKVQAVLSFAREAGIEFNPWQEHLITQAYSYDGPLYRTISSLPELENRGDGQ